MIGPETQRWKDKADQESVAQWAAEQAPANAELREALDQILDKLDAIPQAQSCLPQSEGATIFDVG